jgi:hydrogenase maturation protein HypF
MKRAKIIIQGIVQGVGFRPFLYNLGAQFGLTGSITNSGNVGVELNLSTTDDSFNFSDFTNIIRKKAPSIAMIEKIDVFLLENILRINILYVFFRKPPLWRFFVR